MVSCHLADALEDRLITALLRPASFLGIVDVGDRTMLLILASSSHGVNSLSLDIGSDISGGRALFKRAGQHSDLEKARQAPEALHLGA
jgi:hypothetical protein